LPFHFYLFVCILPGKAVPEMTYTVSGGGRFKPYSLTQRTQSHDGQRLGGLTGVHIWHLVVDVRAKLATVLG